MTITPTALLSLPIITTGTESGTWGDVVDNGLTSYLDIAIAGGLSVPITTADVTLALTAGTSGGTNIVSTGATGSTAQYAILNVSGAMTAARNLILPSSSRRYFINNTCTGGFVLTVKGTATTGVPIYNGEKAIVFWNGTDFVKTASQTGFTSSEVIPAGTTAQRDAAPAAGYFRFNTSNVQFEGYNGTAWSGVGGASGGGGNPSMYENDAIVSVSYTMTTGKNASSTGPLTINAGISVTVPSGSTWVIL